MLIMCMPSLFHLRKHPSPDSNTYLNLLILGRAGLWIFSLDSQSSDTITKTYIVGTVILELFPAVKEKVWVTF